MSNIKVISLNAHGKYSTGNIASAVIEKLGGGSKCFYSRDFLDTDYAVKFASKNGMTLDIALTRITGIDSVWSWKNTRKILKALKQENPNVLHIHNLHGFYINYKKLFKYIKKNNVKVVWTLHDCWSFTGHCTHFDYEGCENWKTECKKCPLAKQSYLKSWFFDRSKANFRRKKKYFCGVENMTIVTPSEWLGDLAKQSFLNEYPIKVINNGINTENFKICENQSFKEILPADKKIVIAVASSWGKLKGFDDVVEISRRLPEDYEVVIVGVNEAQKQRLANERIIAVTRTENQQQLAELYSAARVFINTTYEETYPTVNIEALCCGCPIVTYNTGGSIETVNDDTGLVVPKGDIDGMINAIKTISDKNYDRQKMSTEAKTKYSKEVMVDKYIELIKSV